MNLKVANVTRADQITESDYVMRATIQCITVDKIVIWLCFKLCQSAEIV
jgi:hypothetical protein